MMVQERNHLFMLLVWSWFLTFLTPSADCRIMYSNLEENKALYTQESHRCFNIWLEENKTSTDNQTRCRSKFKNGICWISIPANETVSISCPAYNGFNISEKARMTCSADGTWNRSTLNNAACAHDYMNSQVTDLSEMRQEIEISDVLRENIPRLRMLQTIGWAISSLALLIACVVMVGLGMLRSTRNVVHFNMFLGFILRGFASLLMEYILYSNPQLVKTKILDEVTGERVLDESFSHWQCKLLMSFWMYTRLANCGWIFIEALYLHLLMFRDTFSDKSGIRWFIICGWAIPYLFVIPWILVRVYVDNDQCWATYGTSEFSNFRWIIEGPILIVILINTYFFIKLLYLLFQKLRASESTSDQVRMTKYLKLIKSALFLIPLFGVHYVIFIYASFLPMKGDTFETVRMYFDYTLTSFQGLLVGILYCFLNNEVRDELLKKWHRWKLLKTLYGSQSRSTILSSYRRSSSIGSRTSDHKRRRNSSIYSLSQKSSSTAGGSDIPVIMEESCRLLSLTIQTSEPTSDLNQNEVKSEVSSQESSFVSDVNESTEDEVTVLEDTTENNYLV